MLPFFWIQSLDDALARQVELQAHVDKKKKKKKFVSHLNFDTNLLLAIHFYRYNILLSLTQSFWVCDCSSAGKVIGIAVCPQTLNNSMSCKVGGVSL